MSYDKDQFCSALCRVLAEGEKYYTRFYFPGVVTLMMGTCAQESKFGRYIYQIGGGPALGPFQMEPMTETWLWEYIRRKPSLLAAVTELTGVKGPSPWALTYKLDYQILMARIRYLPAMPPIAEFDDIHGHALYWDMFYNRNPHHGFPEDFVDNYKRFCV